MTQAPMTARSDGPPARALGESLHDWLMSDRPRSRRQARARPGLRRLAHVRAQPARDGRAW